MFSINDKISIRQLQILILLNSFGTGVIVLPRHAAYYAGADGWISVIIASGIALLSVWLITSLGRLFPSKSFFEYTAIIASKPVSCLLNILLLFKIVMLISFELSFFGEIVKLIMLKETPFFIIILMLLLVSGYTSAKGFETRARIAEILIFIIFIPLILVFSLASLDVDFTNILPAFKSSPEAVLRGGLNCFSAFMGIEGLLLVNPYINKPAKVRSASLQMILITGIVFTVITVIAICRFGVSNIANQPWPVLEMMDTVDLPGSFIERQEALIMSFWIVSMFAIVNAGLFYGAVISKSVFKKGKHTYYVIAYIIIALLLTTFMHNTVEAYEKMSFLYLSSGIIYAVIIPAALLVLAKIRKVGGAYEKS